MPPPGGVEKAYGLELHLSDPVRVRRVARGGVAAKAGVRLNDALETVGGIDVRGAATDFIYALLQVRRQRERERVIVVRQDCGSFKEGVGFWPNDKCGVMFSRLRWVTVTVSHPNHMICASLFWFPSHTAKRRPRMYQRLPL